MPPSTPYDAPIFQRCVFPLVACGTKYRGSRAPLLRTRPMQVAAPDAQTNLAIVCPLRQPGVTAVIGYATSESFRCARSTGTNWPTGNCNTVAC
jgi:hypothetical protein